MTRYVLVVHGIGEQRKNETVLSVVNRFAEARALDAGLTDDTPAEVLTLGLACGQAGRVRVSGEAQPWLEFEHVPAEWGDPPTGPFLGEAVGQASAGSNLRFVDIHWADLLQADYPRVGEDTVRWADSLRGRLARKTAKPAPDGELPPPYWAQETLRLIRDTVVLVRRVMAFRGFERIDRLIFQDFLGDVQLYGEYALTRGRAVRRFHELIARIEAAHDRPDDPPRYTLIAHSLGTVMSFDALLYALARRELRAERADERPRNLPFPGYLADEEAALLHAAGRTEGDPLPDSLAFLDTSWIDRVDAFVTLGSPIDKYLVLWWQNYKYLTDAEWMRPGRSRKIPHFNYCDEQDPVGHKLDTVMTTAAYQAAFEPREDLVFNRYALPGAAHVEYWKDRDLFRWILFRAVDGVDPQPKNTGRSVPPPEWFEEDIYKKILAISYKVTPYAIIVLDFFTFTLAWYAVSWHATALAAVAFVVTCLIGRNLIDLTVWWRQILVAKDPKLMNKRAEGGGLGGQVGQALRQTAIGFRRSTGTGKEGERLKRRAEHGAAFRGRLAISTATFAVLAGLTTGLYLGTWGETFRWGRLALFGLVAVATVEVWRRLFRSRDVAWREAGSNGAGGSSGAGGSGLAGATGWWRSLGRLVRAWRVDLSCVAVVVGSMLAGWWLIELLGGTGFADLALFEPILGTYRAGDFARYVPDVAFCIASYCVVSAVVFCYLRFRLGDVQSRLEANRSTVESFTAYALGPAARPR